MKQTLVDFYKKFVGELSKYIKTKQILIVLSLLFLFAISKEYTLPILYNISGHEIFRKIQSNSLADVSVIIILIVYSITSIVDLYRYDISFYRRRIPPIFLLVILYVYFRWFDYNFFFIRFQLNQNIAYTDAIIVILIYKLLIKKTFLKTNFKSAPTRSVKIISEDKLYFKSHAESLSNFIKGLEFNDCFTIGIEGAWGYGKSSYISFVLSYFTNDKFKIIELSALDDSFYDGNKNLLYKKLELRLKDSLVDEYDLTVLVKKYFNLLGNYFGNEQNLLNKLIGEDKDFDELKDSINRMILKSNCKLIIVIDDLDRLMPNEVMNLLVAMRSILNFNNTIFIIAYDKANLQEILKSLSIKSKNYLDKFIDLELNPPKYSNDVLTNKLRELLIINNAIEEEIVYKAVTNDLFNYINSLRDVYRFYYSLSLNYQQVEGLVSLYDFVRLELIRFLFPSDHLAIYKYKDELFTTKEDYKKEYYWFEKDLAGINENIELNSGSIILIEDVFNKVESDDDFSAQYLSRFNLYFNYENSFAFSNIAFAKARFSKESKSLITFSDSLIDKKEFTSLFEIFSSIRNFESKDDFEKVLNALVYSYSNYFDYIQHNIRNLRDGCYEFKQIIEDFLESHSVNNKYTKSEIASLLLSNIGLLLPERGSKSLVMACMHFSFCKSFSYLEKDILLKYYKSLSIAILRTLQSYQTSEIVDNGFFYFYGVILNEKYIREGLFIYHYGTDFKEEVHKKVIENLFLYAKTHFRNFFRLVFNYSIEKNEYSFYINDYLEDVLNLNNQLFIIELDKLPDNPLKPLFTKLYKMIIETKKSKRVKLNLSASEISQLIIYK